ncbi:MAG: flagellar protein FlaG [Acidobacteria bacterium]|nr:flagellar protein FlaG [Acidobacteriota bacterium]
MQVESYSIRSALPSTPAVASGSKSAISGADGASLPDVPVAGQGGETQAAPAPDGKLEKVIDSIQEAVKSSNISLEFSRDEDSGSIVIKLVDQTSGEAVQQIPSKAVLHLAAVLGKLQGQIFDRKA